MFEKYDCKKIKIISKSGKVYIGVGEYVDPEDNYNGEEELIIDAEGYDYPIGFNKRDIVSIEEID